MILFLLSLIFGRCKIYICSTNAKEIVTVLKTAGVLTSPILYDKKVFTVTVSEYRAKTLCEMLKDAGIEYEFERLMGIPRLWHRYKKRPGIVVGVVIFLVITAFSGKIIWDFEVTGNTEVSDTEIIEALEKQGCFAGAYIKNVDFDLVQNDSLIDSDKLAWVSVNMDGNLARVEVREKRILPVDDPPAVGRFSNIVAAEDGVVELCFVKNGKAVVEMGDVVRRGDLLISGVIDVGEKSVRYERADGEVKARVYREFSSFVPFEYEKKIPTGEMKRDVELKFFGKSIKVSKKGGIDWEFYDIIKEDEKLSLPFGISLPIWRSETVYSEMKAERETLNETGAVSLAKKNAFSQLNSVAGNFQVTSVSENISVDDKGATVTLGVYGITDISANYGFSVSDTDTEENEDKLKNEEDYNGQRRSDDS